LIFGLKIAVFESQKSVSIRLIRPIRSPIVSQNHPTLSISMLPKGTYLLKVGSEVTKFVKQ
jgi:hypothetical protein